MTMLLHDGTNHNGLFDVLGQCFGAFDALNTAASSTVPTQVDDFIDQAQTVNGGSGQPPIADVVAALKNVPARLSQWQGNSSTLASALQSAAQSILLAYTQTDSATLASDLPTNLEYLINQMIAGTVTGGDHVTAASPTVSVSTGSGNAGDVALAATLVGGDGQLQQNALAEAISLSVSTAGMAPQIAATSPAAVTSRLSYLWPGGSGLNTTFNAVSAARSLLDNGDFEADAIANQPDDWLIAVGTPGTTLFVTGECQQSVAISGSPTGGSYILCWVDQKGTNRATAPLPWNATQRQVQAALQAVPGLAQVTVATTGTSPNLTHAITFWGLGGAVSTLTYLSQLTGGSPSINVSVVTAADSNTYNGQALKIVGNASELTTLYALLPALTPNTTYMLGFRARIAASETITAGSLAVEIVSGIGGSVINDSAGNANSTSLNLLTSAAVVSNSAWQFYSLSFRLPPSAAQPVYLRIRLATALDSGGTLYLDEMAIVQATELYSGGPLVAAFSGKFAAAAGDAWTVTVTNAMAGKFQKAFNRFFAMADSDLVLPVTSVAGGGALISDSLIPV